MKKVEENDTKRLSTASVKQFEEKEMNRFGSSTEIDLFLMSEPSVVWQRMKIGPRTEPRATLQVKGNG